MQVPDRVTRSARGRSHRVPRWPDRLMARWQVSLGYAMDSPDLRLTWLSNLADFHLASKNYEEHAQCKLLAAALVCQFLHVRVRAVLLLSRRGQKTKHKYGKNFAKKPNTKNSLNKNVQREQDAETATKLGLPPSTDAFLPMCPNVRAQPPLQHFAQESVEEGMYESRQFTVQGLLDLLKVRGLVFGAFILGGRLC